MARSRERDRERCQPPHYSPCRCPPSWSRWRERQRKNKGPITPVAPPEGGIEDARNTVVVSCLQTQHAYTTQASMDWAGECDLESRRLPLFSVYVLLLEFPFPIEMNEGPVTRGPA